MTVQQVNIFLVVRSVALEKDRFADMKTVTSNSVILSTEFVEKGEVEVQATHGVQVEDLQVTADE